MVDQRKRFTYIAGSLVLVGAGDADVDIFSVLTAPDGRTLSTTHNLHVSLVQLVSDRAASS